MVSLASISSKWSKKEKKSLKIEVSIEEINNISYATAMLYHPICKTLNEREHLVEKRHL